MKTMVLQILNNRLQGSEGLFLTLNAMILAF